MHDDPERGMMADTDRHDELLDENREAIRRDRRMELMHEREKIDRQLEELR